MAIYRDTPYPSCRFTVDLGTGEVWSPNTGLLEVVFPEARLVVSDYRSGNSRSPEPQKVQTGVEYGTLILRRTVNGSLDWYQWWNEFRNGSTGNLRSVTVNLMNEDLSNVVLTWRFNLPDSPTSPLPAQPPRGRRRCPPVGQSAPVRPRFSCPPEARRGRQSHPARQGCG